MTTEPEVQRARWYPQQPPALYGETSEQYTNRLIGADHTDRRPYDHCRNRQCSIGYHNECSDRDNSGYCECPCHHWKRDAMRYIQKWNAVHLVGIIVTFPESANEPPASTTSAAYIDEHGEPVVDVDTFMNAVHLAWLTPEAPDGI